MDETSDPKGSQTNGDIRSSEKEKKTVILDPSQAIIPSDSPDQRKATSQTAEIIPYPSERSKSSQPVFEEDPEKQKGQSETAPGFKSELRLDLSGYEGPIDVLLTLARDQKVDLSKISILELADQYLLFVQQARKVRLELAADYLVMAAWLAYLKSRLLLPDPPNDDEPTGEEMAESLAFQLQRLEAMRKVGAKLMERPQLGQDFFARGDPEPLQVDEKPVYDVSLYHLLKAYADHHRRQEHSVYQLVQVDLYSVDEALRWLARLVGRLPRWTAMSQFLPEDTKDGTQSRSALASTLVAGLELAKQGRMQIRQDRTYGPIFVRSLESHAGEIEGLMDERQQTSDVDAENLAIDTQKPEKPEQ